MASCSKEPITEFRTITVEWDKTLCYGKTVDVEGPIEEYSDGLWTMAVTGSVTKLKREIGGSSGGSIPSGLGDDTDGVGYASRLSVDGYIIAMYHPIPSAPDHFIVYHPDTGRWWRYDVGDNEGRCSVTLINSN